MKISYAIPVCNELVELQRLVDFLVKNKRKEDEIVILLDEDNGTNSVEEYLKAKSVDTFPDFTWYKHSLNNNFADHKNYLNSLCSGDWIFQIDADEYPDEYLIFSLPNILASNPGVEAYKVSRINTVVGLTNEHIEKWRWVVNNKGWVNFPDKQTRIYRNKEVIRWVYPVHEQLVGYKGFADLPGNEEYCLHHPKEIDRQERQNDLYGKIINQSSYSR